MTSSTLRQLRRYVLIYAGLAPFVVIAVSPVYWMAITAFKLQIEEAAGVPIALLYNFVLDHFIEGLTGVGVVS